MDIWTLPSGPGSRADPVFDYYYGADSSTAVNTSLIGRLTKTKYEHNANKQGIELNNQYAYFAFPASLGKMEFKVGVLWGGFNEPVKLSINSIEYNVYRSVQVLKGKADFVFRYAEMQAKDYLGVEYMIRPKGGYAIMEAENIDIDGERVDAVIYELRRNTHTNLAKIEKAEGDIVELQSQIQSIGKTIKIKGRVNTVNDLPETAEEGDMYFVGTATAESFEEYVYTEQGKWEYLGSINDIDLSDYVTKSFLSNTLGEYAKLSDIPTVPTNYLTGGSQTRKSTADGGKNVYTFTKSDGTTSTLEVFNGTKGSKGDTGPQGEQGIQGIQGPQGLKGDTGSTGATGPQGPKGDTGATGATGPQGPKGDTGDTGPQGPAGKNGTNGSNGVSCTHSWSGTTLSVTSASGTSSANLKGDKGDKGDTGATGPQGPKGDTGATGATGSQGPKGDTGDTGATGPQGPAGKNGSNGVSCTHSWNGTTLTVTSASGTSSANLKGDKGDKGDTGSKGDTGPQGPQGPAGQNATTTAVFSTSANGLAPKSTSTTNFLRGDGTWQPVITSHQSLAGKQDVILSAKPTIKTGSTAMAKISLNTLFAWLISQKYITSNTYQMKTFRTSWSYAGNDILQLSANGTNFEVQLAGCEISFIGTATAYNAGEFVLTITAAPTSSFTLTSGYTDGKNSTFVYRCNGSGYSPNWQRYVTSAYSLNKTVPSDAKFTDTTYSAATTSANGLMSSADKTKLNGIATGATAVSESTVSGWGFTKNSGTYSKPSTGIPKTDLASAVQTSLGKADTALQSHQSLANYVKTDDSRLSNSRPANGGTATNSYAVLPDSTIVYGSNKLQYRDKYGDAGNDPTKICNPFNDWFHHIIMNHANGNGYYFDLAACFHSNRLFYRRVVSGTDQGWVEIASKGDIPSEATTSANGLMSSSDKQLLIDVNTAIIDLFKTNCKNHFMPDQLNLSWVGLSVTTQSDGGIKVTGTVSGSNTWEYLKIGTINIPLTAGTRYWLKDTGFVNVNICYAYLENGSLLNGVQTFSSSKNIATAKTSGTSNVFMRVGKGQSINTVLYPMLCHVLADENYTKYSKPNSNIV